MFYYVLLCSFIIYGIIVYDYKHIVNTYLFIFVLFAINKQIQTTKLEENYVKRRKTRFNFKRT